MNRNMSLGLKKMLAFSDRFFICVVFSTVFHNLRANADYAPTGCSFQGGNQGEATCDFASWNPPLQDADFGPGDIYQLVIDNVDGTIPSLAFGDIGSGNDNTTGIDTEIKFQCDLENIILSSEVFTSNLNWIKLLTFKNCYIQDGISSGILSNLTSLEEFKIDGGIVGSLASDIFAGLTNLVKITINADFLDVEVPSRLFSNLTSLEKIDLRSSGISSIPVDLFTNLYLLTTLDLSGNSLTTLPQNLFMSLVSLSTVDLGTNSWDCTCDLAWLSSWSLYTGMSVDVTCTTPSEYFGVSLGRAVASLGCINTATTSGTVENSGNTDTGDTLIYIALGAAGLATLLTLVTATALCCVCSKMNKIQTRGDGQYKTRKRTKIHEQKTPIRQPSVSTVQERPPSYKPSERMFISTPVQGPRDSKIHPYYNVSYKRGIFTSEA